jgi:hypothetical protein
MGVLAPGSAHARPSDQPPSTLVEIFRHTCLQSHLQTSHPTPQKSYLKFLNPRTTYENAPLTPNIFDSAGGRGCPRIFLGFGILLFLLVRSPCTISEPYDNFWISPLSPQICDSAGGRGGPLLGFWTTSPTTRRKGKIHKIVATFISACSQGHGTHSARTNNNNLYTTGCGSLAPSTARWTILSPHLVSSLSWP